MTPPADPATALAKMFSRLDADDINTLNWLLVAARDAGNRCAYTPATPASNETPRMGWRGTYRP